MGDFQDPGMLCAPKVDFTSLAKKLPARMVTVKTYFQWRLKPSKVDSKLT